MESPYIRRKPYTCGEDLSEVGSVCSSEVSTLVDENLNEWPLVQIRNCHPQTLTSRRLPVTENFVAELKSHTPVPHGLLRVSYDNNCATLSVRPTELTRRPCMNENGFCVIDNSIKVSHCAVPQKRKEIVLSISKVKSSICSIEETRTFQKISVNGYSANRIQAGDSQLPPVNLSDVTSASESAVENGYTDDSERQTVLFRCIVEPEFSTVWPKDENCCRTRLEVCRRELGSHGEFVSSCSRQCDISMKADKVASAAQFCQQLTSTALSKVSAQMNTDDVSYVAVQSENACMLKYEQRDTEKKVPVIVRYTGRRSQSAERLNDNKHSSHPINNGSVHTVQMRKSLSDHSASIHHFSNELHSDKDSICRQSNICRRDPVGKYFDGRIMSASCDNVANLNMTCRSKMSGSRGSFDWKITENRPHSHCWKDWTRTWSLAKASDQERLVEDVSTSRSLTLMRDMLPGHTYCSCDHLPPVASVISSYLNHSHSRHSQPLMSASSVTVRPVKSETNLVLLPTSWVSSPEKNDALRQTFVAHSPLSTSRSCYLQVTSERYRINGVLSHLSPSCTSTSSPDVSSYLLESNSSRDKHDPKYRNDVLGICSVQRTSPGTDVAWRCDSEGGGDDQYVIAVSSGDSLPHIRSDEVLDTVPCSSDSLASISAQAVDLSESSADSISGPCTSSIVDQYKAEQLQTTPALRQVNDMLQ